MNRSLIFCFLFVLNFGCSNNDYLEDYLIKLQTDKSTYIADSSTTIYLNVSNMGRSTVYYVCHGEIILQEYENGNLNNRWMVSGFSYCLSRNPISPDSLVSYYFTLKPWEKFSDAIFNEEVRYKFYFYLFKGKSLEHPLDDDDQISNYFKIIRE
jgi:hypothetical protein